MYYSDHLEVPFQYKYRRVPLSKNKVIFCFGRINPQQLSWGFSFLSPCFSTHYFLLFEWNRVDKLACSYPNHMLLDFMALVVLGDSLFAKRISFAGKIRLLMQSHETHKPPPCSKLQSWGIFPLSAEFLANVSDHRPWLESWKNLKNSFGKTSGDCSA